MEEKKEERKVAEETAQPTYEQLKDWCNQLLTQRNQLSQRLNQVTSITNKLPWLFEVLKAKEFFTDDFVASCAAEITYIMTPEQPEQTEEPQKEKD